MAHLKNVLMDTEHLPVSLSSRMAILKAFGGTVKGLYDASFTTMKGNLHVMRGTLAVKTSVQMVVVIIVSGNFIQNQKGYNMKDLLNRMVEIK